MSVCLREFFYSFATLWCWYHCNVEKSLSRKGLTFKILTSRFVCSGSLVSKIHHCFFICNVIHALYAVSWYSSISCSNSVYEEDPNSWMVTDHRQFGKEKKDKSNAHQFQCYTQCSSPIKTYMHYTYHSSTFSAFIWRKGSESLITIILCQVKLTWIHFQC